MEAKLPILSQSIIRLWESFPFVHVFLEPRYSRWWSRRVKSNSWYIKESIFPVISTQAGSGIQKRQPNWKSKGHTLGHNIEYVMPTLALYITEELQYYLLYGQRIKKNIKWLVFIEKVEIHISQSTAIFLHQNNRFFFGKKKKKIDLILTQAEK